MNNEELIERVKEAIEIIRPYIQRDGGDVEFVSLENTIVYVDVKGACVGCGMLQETLKEGIEGIILDEVPEITEVRLASDLYL